MVLDWIELNGSHGVCVCSTMPEFGDDCGRVFSMSSAEYHDRCYHTAPIQLRRRFEGETLASSGFDVCAVETSLPTTKTCQMNRYCDRIHEAAKHFDQLYEHYQKMRPARWKTYKYEQKALHELCQRVKGYRKIKKSDIIVALGAAKFGPMRGKRAPPTEKVRRALKREVTVVMVNEHRTSRTCSNLCALESALASSRAAEARGKAAEPGDVLMAEEEDEGGGGGGGEGEEERAQQEEERRIRTR